jgi:predicted nucleic acid-binding protein
VPIERRVAVDTSVVISHLTAGHADTDPQWLPASTWVFQAAEDGHHQLVVPAIVIAEVAGAGGVRGTQIATGDRKRRIDAVQKWLSRGAFIVADIDERVARRAAELAIRYHLKGADAAVVAAAELWRCSALYTWDNQHLRLGAHIEGLSVVQPQQFESEQGTLGLGV